MIRRTVSPTSIFICSQINSRLEERNIEVLVADVVDSARLQPGCQ